MGLNDENQEEEEWKFLNCGYIYKRQRYTNKHEVEEEKKRRKRGGKCGLLNTHFNATIPRTLRHAHNTTSNHASRLFIRCIMCCCCCTGE